jgi:hypothetical protein
MANKTIKITRTERGFPYAEFTDLYGQRCSIQKSSLADDQCIWLGLAEVKAQVMARDAATVGLDTQETTGWVVYPIPAQIQIPTRMHLNRKQVAALLPFLQRFVETGEIQEVDNG